MREGRRGVDQARVWPRRCMQMHGEPLPLRAGGTERSVSACGHSLAGLFRYQ